jgi:hypothetical protein
LKVNSNSLVLGPGIDSKNSERILMDASRSLNPDVLADTGFTVPRVYQFRHPSRVPAAMRQERRLRCDAAAASRAERYVAELP